MTAPSAPPAVPRRLLHARLPRWLLPQAWPQRQGQPLTATVSLGAGRIESVVPTDPALPAAPGDWNLAGAPVLPGLVDAHTHLDKTFTLPRMGQVQPGLLGAIEAMMADRMGWTAADVNERASRALEWAWDAGCVHVRSHVDWWEADSIPVAWTVLAQLSQRWRGRIRLEQVSLMKLPLFEQLSQARRLAPWCRPLW